MSGLDSLGNAIDYAQQLGNGMSDVLTAGKEMDAAAGLSALAGAVIAASSSHSMNSAIGVAQGSMKPLVRLSDTVQNQEAA